MKNIVGFKHGLMLLYQFIEFVVKIHQNTGLVFGHLDFQNLYYVYNKKNLKRMRSPNRVGAPTPKASESASSQPQNFSVSLLFLERNLYNLTIEASDDVKKISQTSLEDQQAFCLTYLNQTKEESKVSSQVGISEAQFEEQKQPRNRFDSEKKLEIRNALYGHDIVIERASLDEKESSSPKAKQTFPLFNSRFDSGVTSLKTFAKTIHQYCNCFKGEEAHYQKVQEHE